MRGREGEESEETGLERPEGQGYSPLQKVEINDFGHADFEIINFKMILSIFDGPNSEQKNANQFFPDVFAARHISDIFWAVKLAPKFLKRFKKCVK